MNTCWSVSVWYNGVIILPSTKRGIKQLVEGVVKPSDRWLKTTTDGQCGQNSLSYETSGRDSALTSSFPVTNVFPSFTECDI